MSRQLTEDGCMVQLSHDQISADLAGEAVILNLKSGVYYGLNEVGARIWQMVQERTSVRAIVGTVLEEYAVDAERCERDVLALLQSLADEGLIEIRHESD